MRNLQAEGTRTTERGQRPSGLFPALLLRRRLPSREQRPGLLPFFRGLWDRKARSAGRCPSPVLRNGCPENEAFHFLALSFPRDSPLGEAHATSQERTQPSASRARGWDARRSNDAAWWLPSVRGVPPPPSRSSCPVHSSIAPRPRLPPSSPHVSLCQCLCLCLRW